MTRRHSPLVRAVTGLGSLLLLAALTAGLPAALYAVGGSPIPKAVPAWHQIAITLTQPDHGAVLLATVRWVSWIAWAIFTLTVILEVVSQVRGWPTPQLLGISPLQGFAAALIGTALLGLLPTAHLTRPLPHRPAQPAATAPLHPGQAVRAADTAFTTRLTHADVAEVGGRRWVTVTEGEDLWSIAAHHLGNPDRWTEIWRLNHGRLQPDGRALTDPDLIYPGWHLRLPPRHSAPTRPAPRPDTTRPHQQHPAPSGSAHPRPSGHDTARPHTTPHPPRPAPANPHGGRTRPVGIGLPGGGLVGVTLAAAISAALIAWRLHRRRTALPRWPIPTTTAADPPLPPAITALRRAHLRGTAATEAEERGDPWPDDEDTTAAWIAGLSDPPGDDGLDEFGAPSGPDPWPSPGNDVAASSDGEAGTIVAAPVPARLPVTVPASAPGEPAVEGVGDSWRPAPPPAAPLPAGSIAFGSRDGTEIPFTEMAGGVGLTGPGADGAARALLIAILAAGAQAVIPETDLHHLTGGQLTAPVPGVTPGLPDGLTVTPTLAGALDYLETAIAQRTRLRDSEPDGDLPPLALIASPGQSTAARVRAVLEAGALTGLTGVILGDHPTGTTCRVAAGGTILAATDPTLAGAEAFHLPATDTATMLTLLRGAQGHTTETPTPAANGSHTTHPPETPGSGNGGASTSGPGGGQSRATARASPAGHNSPRTSLQQAPAAGDAAEPVPQGGHDAGTASARLGTITDDDAATAKPVRLSVLGPVQITAGGTELPGGLRKARELLAFLALHPAGVTADALGEALWPESDPRYIAKQRGLALRRARDMLRAATRLTTPMFIILASERYRLDPALIDVNLWHFDAALGRARTAGDDQQQLAALREATALYRGPLADGAVYEWAERYAEATRRRALDALTRTAEILRRTDPGEALAVLETALTHDPYNEAVYQAIIGIQHQLGRPDAARRTFSLLENRLADLGVVPRAETRQHPGATVPHAR